MGGGTDDEATSNPSPRSSKKVPKRQQQVHQPSLWPRRLGIGSGAAVVLLLVAFVVFGNNASVRDPMTGATEFNIPVQPAALVSEGADLYQASCASCHGSDLRGTDLGPSQLSVVYQPGHHPDQAYALAAFNGVSAHHWQFGDMPPISGLSQVDMDRIVAFIREMQRTQGFEPYPPT
jgi:mono/diheme cytochrome c family protein